MTYILYFRGACLSEKRLKPGPCLESSGCASCKNFLVEPLCPRPRCEAFRNSTQSSFPRSENVTITDNVRDNKFKLFSFCDLLQLWIACDALCEVLVRQLSVVVLKIESHTRCPLLARGHLFYEQIPDLSTNIGKWYFATWFTNIGKWHFATWFTNIGMFSCATLKKSVVVMRATALCSNV